MSVVNPLLSPGLRGEARRVVTDADTASALGSGDVPVFATPAVLALIERAACAALDGALGDGETSVGTWADVTHSAASPIGAEVVATAELISVEGRVLEFACQVRDGAGPIAHGHHRRAVVDRDRFLSRVRR
jgi:predicted thioesterase